MSENEAIGIHFGHSEGAGQLKDALAGTQAVTFDLDGNIVIFSNRDLRLLLGRKHVTGWYKDSIGKFA
jgi:hypothetical protein